MRMGKMTDINLQSLEQSRDLILKEFPFVPVTSQETQERASAMLVGVRTALKKIDTERKTWTDPIEQHKKRIIAEFKKITEPLERLEGELTMALTAYRDKLERDRLAEQAKLQKREDKKFERQVENGTAMIPEPMKVSLEAQPKSTNGITYVVRWKARVVDVSKIPNEYMIPHYQMLDDLAQASKGKLPPPPGVEFYQETTTRVKG